MGDYISKISSSHGITIRCKFSNKFQGFGKEIQCTSHAQFLVSLESKLARKIVELVEDCIIATMESYTIEFEAWDTRGIGACPLNTQTPPHGVAFIQVLIFDATLTNFKFYHITMY